jgi:hypothetical protein
MSLYCFFVLKKHRQDWAKSNRSEPIQHNCPFLIFSLKRFSLAMSYNVWKDVTIKIYYNLFFRNSIYMKIFELYCEKYRQRNLKKQLNFNISKT